MWKPQMMNNTLKTNCCIPSGRNQRKNHFKQISKRFNNIDWDRKKRSLMNITRPSHSTGSKLEIMHIQPKWPYMKLIFI